MQLSDLKKVQLDRTSSVPYHVQVTNILRDLIVRREYDVGEALPSEAVLARAFGVSRPVIRQALETLKNDKLIVRQRGKGTYVAPLRVHERFVSSSMGFFEDMQRQGYVVRSKVLEYAIVRSNPEVASIFGALGEAGCHQIVRARSVGSDLVQVVRNLVPLSLVPRIRLDALETGSLYEMLRNDYGIRIGRVRQKVSVQQASSTLAALLQVNRGLSVLVIEGSAWDHHGRLIDSYTAHHRGDIVELDFDVQAGSERVRD